MERLSREHKPPPVPKGMKLYACAHINRRGKPEVTHFHANNIQHARNIVYILKRRVFGKILAVGESLGGWQDDKTGEITI